MSRFVLNGGARRRAIEIAAAASVTLLPSLAFAHFNLQDPPNWTTETTQGTPQKDWPCGNEPNGSGTAPMATGPTTAFKPGDKITIKLVETVPHGGHYRVALATSGDMMDLPADMSADASGGNCQNDDMQPTATFPILADGMLQHAQSEMLSGVQSLNVTLPSDVTCDKCVLQVREYMTPHSNQPETSSGTAAGMNGCYYHHCAFISISNGSGTGGMSGGGAPSGGMSGSGGVAPSAGGAAGMSMGGAMGQAGTLSSGGGAVGAAGAANGGQPSGTSGAPAAGGSTMSGTGGTTTGSGGTSAGTATNGGHAPGTGGAGGTSGGAVTGEHAGTSSGNAASTDDKSGGCSLGSPARQGSLPWSVAGALGLVCLVARRRRA